MTVNVSIGLKIERTPKGECDMKMVLVRNEDGSKAQWLRLSGITRGHGREVLLSMFRDNPKMKYAETNVRRYTASDIYAGRLGQAI